LSAEVPDVGLGVGTLLLLSLIMVSVAGCCTAGFNPKITAGLCLPGAAFFAVMLV